VSVAALAIEPPANSPTSHSVAVVAEEVPFRDRAGELADELHLPLFEIVAATRHSFDLLLTVGAVGLAIVPTDSAIGGAVRVDFVRGPTAFRRLAAGGRRQPLALAMGMKRGYSTVLDATAGLGRDAFLLACLGCRVTAVERSAIFFAMLRDGLARARSADDAKLRAVVDRMSLHLGDSRDVLRAMTIEDAPDVVYIDTMYEPRGKSALAKKEMRICRMLVGDDGDAFELLDAARAVARHRVVVKRHRKAEPLAPGVSVSHAGRVVRYDVYLASPPRRSV